MNAWQKVWRDGIAPQLTTAALEALAGALAGDDPALLQGATTSPPPLQAVRDWPVDGCCPISLAGWKGMGLETVAEVEEHFARVCYETDNRLGESAAVRWFLNWWDDTPRFQARLQLLAEVEHTLAGRQPAAA